MFNFPYRAVQLTQEINRYPNVYGLMNALNVFPAEPIASRVVEIRFEDGVLAVLAADEVGAAGQTVERETGQAIYIGVPHFPQLEVIRAQDLQGFIDVIAGKAVPKQFASEVAKRLRVMRNNHAITREFTRVGALRGLVKDGRGRTIINLYSTFNIQPYAIDFNLGTATTDVVGIIAQLINYISENLRGETMSYVEVVCGTGWFNRLVQHPKVEKYWLQQEAATQLQEIERNRLGGQWGRVFKFQTVMFREYTGSFPVRDPVTRKLASVKIMGDLEARARPVGTLNTFATFDGPVNHMDLVNEPGQEIFVSPKLLDHGEGVEFKSQSNCLPICKRPELLVDCTSST